MVKRTIEISRAGSGVGQNGVHLAARDGQVLILTKTEPPRPLPANPPNLLPGGSIPIEDVGLVMVDQREASYSHHALVSLAEAGAAVVLCGADHLPCAMVLPLAEHTQLQSRLRLQIDASAPTLKRCWQAVVRAKLRAQAATVDDASARRRLFGLAQQTRSGDPENAEGLGAALYWPALFADCPAVAMPFRRIAGEGRAREHRDLAPPPNNLLDYGYAALRAMVARALVSAGLLPALGIKHIGRANAFNLADDLMEPLRPIIDARVKYLAAQVDNARELQLDPPTKAELLKVLAEPVLFPSAAPTRPATMDKGPLMVGITRMVASFVRVLEGGVADAVARLDFPVLPHWPSTAKRTGEDSTDSASTPPDNGEEEHDGP